MASDHTPAQRGAQRPAWSAPEQHDRGVRAARKSRAVHAAEQRRDSAALNLSALMLGAGLSLKGVPVTAQIEDPTLEALRPLFLALFKAGVLPVLNRGGDESPARFIRRAIKTWGAHHHPYLQADLLPDGAALKIRIDLHEPLAIPIDDFHGALAGIHPRLAGSILAQVKAAGQGGWEVFTHADACHWHLSGNQKTFWLRTRAEAETALGVSAGTLTNAQLRAHVKRHKVITPAHVRRKLGADTVAGLRRPLDHGQITRLLARRPAQARAYRELRRVLAAYAEHSHELRDFGASDGGPGFGLLLDANPDHHDHWTPLQEIFWHARADNVARVSGRVTVDDPGIMHDLPLMADIGFHLLESLAETLMDWPDNIRQGPRYLRVRGPRSLGEWRGTPTMRETKHRRNP